MPLLERQTSELSGKAVDRLGPVRGVRESPVVRSSRTRRQKATDALESRFDLAYNAAHACASPR